jgi:hypothetical protein
MRILGLLLAATLLGGAVGDVHAAAARAGSAVGAVPSTDAAARAPFSFDLYRSGDFVAQYTSNWCVGASIQMMLNIVRPTNEGSRARQQALWQQARALSASRYGGANPRGWTAVLSTAGIGRYALVGVPDYTLALRSAAAALRRTGRPVGLLMWAGRHAWVMSGFTSRGDPLTRPDFTVTGIRVLDPLYPRSTVKWGTSPPPDSLLTPASLARVFVPRVSRRQPDYVLPGSWVLILPLPDPLSPEALRQL